MKVLYLLHKVEVPVHQHIVDHLIDNNISVDVKTIGPAPSNEPTKNVWGGINSPEYCDKIDSMGYDFILSNTHSSLMKKFYSNVKPKISFIDIEHDLFSGKPEMIPGSVVFTCQDKHTEYCKDNSIKYIQCRWPKLDVNLDRLDFKVDNIWEEVVFIGTSAINPMIRSKAPLNKIGFSKVWYKKYLPDWKCPVNSTGLPDIFTGPLGIRHCADNFKFIITQNSSCFVEFLLMGGIPILLPNHMKTSSIFNEILSDVFINKSIGTFKALTVENLQFKLKLLKEDKSLYNRTRQIMLDCWVDAEYFKLPSAAEAICSFIKNNGEIV